MWTMKLGRRCPWFVWTDAVCVTWDVQERSFSLYISMGKRNLFQCICLFPQSNLYGHYKAHVNSLGRPTGKDGKDDGKNGKEFGSGLHYTWHCTIRVHLTLHIPAKFKNLSIYVYITLKKQQNLISHNSFQLLKDMSRSASITGRKYSHQPNLKQMELKKKTDFKFC